MPSPPGRTQVRQHQLEPFVLKQPEGFLRLTDGRKREAGLGEDVPVGAYCHGIAVHHQYQSAAPEVAAAGAFLATDRVKVNRLPKPTHSLSARMPPP